MKLWHVVLLAAVAAGIGAFVVLGRGASKEAGNVAGASRAIPNEAAGQAAAANVRTAVADLEAYHAVSDTYAGAPIAVAGVRVVHADATEYCVESTVDGVVASSRGPGGTILSGGC